MIVGQQFSENFQITNEVHISFMQTFKDFNALHTNDDYAKSKGFEAKVMHGNILCGFLSCFVGEMLPFKNTIIHSIEIVFRKPSYLHENLELQATVIEIYESVNTYLFKFKFKCKNETRASGKIQIGILV
jgi:acyl dehydratase